MQTYAKYRLWHLSFDILILLITWSILTHNPNYNPNIVLGFAYMLLSLHGLILMLTLIFSLMAEAINISRQLLWHLILILVIAFSLHLVLLI